jgi:hypothetical protein
MKNQAKHTTASIRTATLLLLLLTALLLLVGCKSKLTITEKVVAKTDSSAVISLKRELDSKEIQIEVLKTDLERMREENTRLRSEASSYTINYDTTAPVDPHTGKHPIANETITQSKSLLEKTIREFETLKLVHNKEIETYKIIISDLELTIETLRNENSDLQINEISRFNFMPFVWGIVVGIILIILIYIRRR